jgi:hypothetical protein
MVYLVLTSFRTHLGLLKAQADAESAETMSFRREHNDSDVRVCKANSTGAKLASLKQRKPLDRKRGAKAPDIKMNGKY